MAINRNNLYLAPDFYMIESPGQTDYVMAANCLLQNRLMFASAYPLMPLKESAQNKECVSNIIETVSKNYV